VPQNDYFRVDARRTAIGRELRFSKVADSCH
jgi:hypothetical protein